MTTPPTPPSLRDWGLSWIRTAVPVGWGFLLTFLATRSQAVHDLLATPVVYALAEAVVTLAWYSLARWVESHLPAWLTRLVIGANTPPTYTPPVVVAGDWER